ncbi:MAG: hypothetical protein AB7Y46_19050, partial [Armatimonadota bacterium]
MSARTPITRDALFRPRARAQRSVISGAHVACGLVWLLVCVVPLRAGMESFQDTGAGSSQAL